MSFGAVAVRVACVQEWIQGTKLSDLPAIKAQGMDILQLVNTGIQCSLRQLLEAGFFHAGADKPALAAAPLPSVDP